MTSETIKDILERQRQDINILFDDYNIEIQKHFKDLNQQIKSLKDTLLEKDDIIKKLSEELKDNDFNKQNYQNFSLVSNLSKQIREKDLELKACNSQLRIAKKEIESLKDKIEVISIKDDIESYVKEQSELVLSETQPKEVEVESKNEEINNKESKKEKPKSRDTKKEKQKKEVETIKEVKAKEIEVETVEVVKAKEIEVEEVKVKEIEVVKEVETVEEVNKDDEEETEVSYVRKKIKGTYYFVSDENPHQIYEYLENNDIGSLVGKMNDKKAEFF